MIESLTQEQIAKFPEYVDKWVSIGLSTARCDRKKAEAAAAMAYEAADLKMPNQVIWTDSPVQQMHAYVLVRFELGDNLHLLNDLPPNKKQESYEKLLEKLPEALLKSENKEFSIKEVREEAINGSIYGSQDAGWLSFYNYMRDELGLKEETEKLIGLTELAKDCGWWIPADEVCFMSEKPTLINRDEEGRLHSLTGPALQYADLFSLYCVHGVRLPEYVIANPELITVDKIENEDNLEIKRVMIDQYDNGNPGRYLMDSGAVLEQEDKYGKLYRKVIPGDEDMVMVKVVNSTAEPDGTFNEYFLSVPPECKTAHEAVAWTFEETAATYNPQIET